jgi:hypothetical protein
MFAVRRFSSGVTLRNLQIPVLDSIWSTAIRSSSSAGSPPSPLHGAFCVKFPSSHELLSLSPALSAEAPLTKAKMQQVVAKTTYLDNGKLISFAKFLG